MAARTPLLVGTLVLLLSAAVTGEESTPPPKRNGLLDLSLEELMDTPITSVSRKEAPPSRSAAAVAVITAGDIERLGITGLPEALRLVPGLEVARINAHSWAISARGFNSQ
jgi:iron complex outermembrane receptor protein